jgi:hypothetical protein
LSIKPGLYPPVGGQGSIKSPTIKGKNNTGPGLYLPKAGRVQLVPKKQKFSISNFFEDPRNRAKSQILIVSGLEHQTHQMVAKSDEIYGPIAQLVRAPDS